MKTMHLPILLAALAAATAPAHADDAFEGPSLAVSTGVVNAQTDLLWSGTYPGGSQWADTVRGLSSSKAAGRVAAGYGFHPAPGLHLGVSAFADVGGREIGTYGYRESGPPLYDYVLTMKLTRVRGLAVEPGWSLSESTLAYLRLGLTYGRIELRSEGTDGVPFVDGAAANVRGTALGWGVKHALGRHVSVGVEVTHTRFGQEVALLDGGLERVVMKPRQTQGLINLGYRF